MFIDTYNIIILYSCNLSTVLAVHDITDIVRLRLVNKGNIYSWVFPQHRPTPDNKLESICDSYTKEYILVQGVTGSQMQGGRKIEKFHPFKSSHIIRSYDNYFIGYTYIIHYTIHLNYTHLHFYEYSINEILNFMSLKLKYRPLDSVPIREVYMTQLLTIVAVCSLHSSVHIRGGKGGIFFLLYI